MNKREAILFLEKKRDKAIGDMSFFGEGSRKGLMNEIRVNTYDIAINTLQQVDEPQGEKVVVPDWFDQWYKAVKNDSVYSEETALKLINQCGWGHMLEYPSGENVPDSNMTEWINENRLLANRAILDGYTVKPKRWVVKEGGLVIRKGKHEAKVYFVEGVDEYGILLVNGIQDEYYSDEDCNLDNFYEEFRLLAKKENLEAEVDGSVEEV